MAVVRIPQMKKMKMKMILLSTWVWVVGQCGAQVLTPPYFNLAEGRRITASSTCGVGVSEPELYCKLVGAHADHKDNPNVNLIQGQVCDFCDPSDPELAHPPEYAIDGTERWWQSPPLSRGNAFNEVNLTIDLGQEFHVAYVFIKMANSPRPGMWVLERSTDNGSSWQPWQYFADSPSDCLNHFGTKAFEPITHDASVMCDTEFSKIVPLEGGEIVVSLLNDRPSANNFYNSTILQEWTKATNIRMRLIRTKTLLGHLMSVARQDPTVTRRYFYSIRDISIGGRCVCNGHADTCDITDTSDPYRLLCRCQHNTCGAQCEQCCPGYVQKKWRPATLNKINECELCNCFGHSDECIYDEQVDLQKKSLDTHGKFEGGGVCQNCRHNTEGVNCNRCRAGYFRPYGKFANATDVCHPCQCNVFYSTGSCAEGSGQCECRQEFLPPLCEQCNIGYFGYPDCRPCDCHLNGTRGLVCEVGGGQCPCKANYAGKNCDRCAEGYFNFPQCLSCDCNSQGSIGSTCDLTSGQCACSNNYGGRTCSICDDGFFNYPVCTFCSCDRSGCLPEVCNKESGSCLCKSGYGGSRCDQCAPGFYGYPNCRSCGCNEHGSVGKTCDETGKCQCLNNFAGLTCSQCSPGNYRYPDCLACNCDSAGSVGISCDDDGRCQCKPNFDGTTCNVCRSGFYNYPACEECNCDPAGVLATFAGCGSLTTGELCQCKERVTGRVCNQCRPLYWNLKASNALGCEECNCHLPGTMGNMNVCDGGSGQCFCKPNAASRRCQECRDGTFELKETNLFGCKDCGCDIGGAVNQVCDKDSGQCACHPRISGRTCNEPLQLHYFPTLYQHQYECEDGRTATHTPVRYGYSQHSFPGYSWRGYAVFSTLQREVLMEVFVDKPSLYRVVVRYINPGSEPVKGFVTFTPETSGDIQQTSSIKFEMTTDPRIETVSGTDNLSPSHFVLNPGRWTVAIKADHPILLDYFVLLPAAYYEATILQEHVQIPCKLDAEFGACRHYQYPELHDYSSVRGEAGYVAKNESRSPTQMYTNNELEDLVNNGGEMALLNKDQLDMRVDLFLPKPGRYMLVILYYTPHGGQTSTLMVETSSKSGRDKGRAVLYDCMFTTLCRQAVTDPSGRVAMFHFDNNYITLQLKGPNDPEMSIAIDSVVAIPSRQWNTDLIRPKPACLRYDGQCIDSHFHSIPGTVKIEAEAGNEAQKAAHLPSQISDVNVVLVYLDHKDAVVDIRGRVPKSAQYVFVVHYYQPKHPEFDLDVLIQNGQFYEAVVAVPFCPSSSGCRSLVKGKDGDTRFQILENFLLTLKEPNHKSVWIDYILAIPSEAFKSDVLREMPLDRAVDFITLCGQDHFYMDPNTGGFCRDATFSLTAEYNNGGLPCQCDFDGSLRFECETFGGQCPCKPHVVGRACSECRTGYFGFPNCQPCDCPSTALCHPTSGECICPSRVKGDRCDSCVPNTYGFDPIIGCEECSCNSLGVVKGRLQCDLLRGQCECKPNVVGRMCDGCQAGYWAFPFCQLCDCDLRGTTEEICDQDSARCFCKDNVYGPTCDQCRPGTFHLEEENQLGCTKCFCFGRTDRCSSSTFYASQMLELEGWSMALLSSRSISPLNHTDMAQLHLITDTVHLQIPPDVADGNVVYFSAPEDYLGNKLTSYGGQLSYVVSFIQGDGSGSSIDAPDVIFVGSNMSLVYENVERAVANETLKVKVRIEEHEMRHLSGGPVTREQIMQVLYGLDHLYIRASYDTGSKHASLRRILLDVAVSTFLADSSQALSVEHCHCPPNYEGSSCEDCAPGYYRSQAGPYGGYCVPCQCHGHADTCDPVTGQCINCKHNTTGEECEVCVEGFHGDATVGTPYDCLICACPLPSMSNNFAVSCEFSLSGLEIRCDCKPGYYGPRCNYCAAGFYGQPEVAGESCKLCDCSGNIDSNKIGSCDSQTGDCLQCLNNTFGSACELCAPGFFGDAVATKNCRPIIHEQLRPDLELGLDTLVAPAATSTLAKLAAIWLFVLKTHHSTESGRAVVLSALVLQAVAIDAQRGDQTVRTRDRPRYRTTTPTTTTTWRSPYYIHPSECNCDRCGARDCHHTTGECRCKPNVIGDKCDDCGPGFWGFDSCQGCVDCSCGVASESSQCDLNKGQCRCRAGVTGRTCDRCLPGHWNYNSFGCQACRCNQDYSIGGSCNPQSGQCECLPGVVGERCDHCPHRWALVENVGCHECETCVHVLLDDVERMRYIFSPVLHNMKNVSIAFFAYQHLYNINGTVDRLRPLVDTLIYDPSDMDLRPLGYQVTSLENDGKALDRKVNTSVDQCEEVSDSADKTRKEALDIEQQILKTARDAAAIVDEIRTLAHRIVLGEGPNVDRKIAEAERLLEEIKRRNFAPDQVRTDHEGDGADETLARAKAFAVPVELHQQVVELLKQRVEDLEAKLRELMNGSRNALDQVRKARHLNNKNKVPKGKIEEIYQLATDTNDLLNEGHELLENARKFLEEARVNYEDLNSEAEKLEQSVEQLRRKVRTLENEVHEVKPQVREAEDHAHRLTRQAKDLDNLLADTRQMSENALKAAKSYGNIVDAIEDALRAAEAAVQAANGAKQMSEGIDERAEESKERSYDLLDQAHRALAKVRPALQERLAAAKKGVDHVELMNKVTDDGLEELNRAMDRLPTQTLGPVANTAVNISNAANEKARDALDKIQGISSRLPQDLARMKQIPRDIDEANKAIKQAHKQVDKAVDLVPEISRLMERLGNKTKVIRVLGFDVGDKLAELRRKVALARDQANRIKVGVHLKRNVSLQVRNPEGLNRAATYSKLSLYFKTNQRNGFLAYLGNEVGTHKRLRRTLTDDYMALVIKDGQVVLTMDMGSGYRPIHNSREVADNQWHQVIVERTGKSASLTVKTEDKVDEIFTLTLPGTHAVFNLDQEHSKLFIGGIPAGAQVQPEIQNRHFEGCIEELEFEDSPVGLWNFADGQNNVEGCIERDKLVVLKPGTGMRFDGAGYAILPRRHSYQFQKRVEIALNFRTYASEGLLFLIGRDSDFLSLELQDGKVVFKFNLGSGTAVLTSALTYNDGMRHSVQANRQKKEAILWVDGVEVDSGASPGFLEDLSFTDEIYIGGYPGLHTFRDVTNVPFEGCIDELQIGTGIHDLNKNIQALGVVPGCPKRVARTVSFTKDDDGYVGMAKTDLRSFAQFTFKFKTSEPEGLLFYAANDDQSNYISVSLSDGVIVFRSQPGGEVRTGSAPYNDKEWHYVTATRENEELRLDVDDFEVFQETAGGPGHLHTTTPIYVGGVPFVVSVKSESAASGRPFIGCIGDATVNAVFQNFANATSRLGGSLASCPIADPSHTSSTDSPPTATPSQNYEAVLDTTTKKRRTSSTHRPRTTTTAIPHSLPTLSPSSSQCGLPIQPAHDDSERSLSNGLRFGSNVRSRQEFAIDPSQLQTSTNISLHFKADMPDGILFYVADVFFRDYIALYLLQGKLYLSYNLGSGSMVLSASQKYDDGHWHHVSMVREKKNAILTVDGDIVMEGNAEGSKTKLGVSSPLYIGGVPDQAARNVKNQLRGVEKSMQGCIKRVQMFQDTLQTDVAHYTQLCSDKVEMGSFFSADGGYLTLYDNYRVGFDLRIYMEIKPRSIFGVVMAVHGDRGDYLVLQIINGTVRFTVDNGAGPIEVMYHPPHTHYLCDGLWHTLEAIKSKNVVSLKVDDIFAEPGIGTAGVSSTDTNNPLYFGGLPQRELHRKGVDTTEQFVGCIRKVELNKAPQNLANARTSGAVTANVCPTI